MTNIELKGCTENDFLHFLKQWEIYYSKSGDEKDSIDRTRADNTALVIEDTKKERKAWDAMKHVDNNVFIGLQAIYFFGRQYEGDIELYEEYCYFYDMSLNLGDNTERRFGDLIAKTNFKLFSMKALLKLGRKKLVGKIINDSEKEILNISDDDLI